MDLFGSKRRQKRYEEGRKAAEKDIESIKEDLRRTEERRKNWTYEYRTVDIPNRIHETLEDDNNLAAWDEGGWELVSETFVPDLRQARDIQVVVLPDRSHWAYIFRKKVEHSGESML